VDLIGVQGVRPGLVGNLQLWTKRGDGMSRYPVYLV
jgi:hypothetical protein